MTGRMPLQQLLLLLLIFLGGGPLQETGAATTINFAMIWNQPGMANATEQLFRRYFLPSLQAACPSEPGINDTVYNFFDLPQVGLFDIRLANQQIASLRASNCLFAGAFDTGELALFRQAGVPSGVAGFSGMQVHEIAPLTLLMAADGVFKVLTATLDLPANGTVSTNLCIVLGVSYSLEELQAVMHRFPGSVRFYQLRRDNENAIVGQMKAAACRNFLLASPSEDADYFLAAAYSRLLLSPPYRWFLFNVRLVDKNNFEGFKVVSKNITSMEFGPISIAIENNLTSARDIFAFDLLSIWSLYLRKIVCKEPGEVNQTYSGMTGSFQLWPNGAVERTDWHMHLYGGLGSERQRIGNWTYSGNFSFAKPPNRVADEATIISELNKNRFRVVTILVSFKRLVEKKNFLLKVAMQEKCTV